MARKPAVDVPPLTHKQPKIELRTRVQFVVQFSAYDDKGDPAPVFRDDKGNQMADATIAVQGGLSEQSFAAAREALLKQKAEVEAGVNAPAPAQSAPAPTE